MRTKTQRKTSDVIVTDSSVPIKDQRMSRFHYSASRPAVARPWLDCQRKSPPVVNESPLFLPAWLANLLLERYEYNRMYTKWQDHIRPATRLSDFQCTWQFRHHFLWIDSERYLQHTAGRDDNAWPIGDNVPAHYDLLVQSPGRTADGRLDPREAVCRLPVGWRDSSLEDWRSSIDVLSLHRVAVVLRPRFWRLFLVQPKRCLLDFRALSGWVHSWLRPENSSVHRASNRYAYWRSVDDERRTILRQPFHQIEESDRIRPPLERRSVVWRRTIDFSFTWRDTSSEFDFELNGTVLLEVPEQAVFIIADRCETGNDKTSRSTALRLSVNETEQNNKRTTFATVFWEGRKITRYVSTVDRYPLHECK